MIDRRIPELEAQLDLANKRIAELEQACRNYELSASQGLTMLQAGSPSFHRDLAAARANYRKPQLQPRRNGYVLDDK